MYRYRTRDLAELGERLLTVGRRSRKRGLRRSVRFSRSGNMLTVRMVVHHEHLFQCFLELKREGGDAPGVDGVRISELATRDGVHLAMKLCEQIEDESYEPSPRRPVKIPKDNGKGYRTLRVPTVQDRMLAKAVDACLTPVWERQFHPNSWGFRRGRNTLQMLAHLKADVETSGHTVVAIADVANAFDSVPLELVFAVHRSVISERVERYFSRLELHDCYIPQTAAMYLDAESETEGLLELVDWALTASPPEVMHGIDQGGPYSPTAMNALLHFLHDVAIDGLPCLSGWYRYADNLVYLFKNAAEGESFLQAIADHFEKHELRLKGDRQIVDLADPRVAPEVLGFTVSLVDRNVVYRLDHKAWNGLRNHLATCHEADNPPAQARAVLRGWLQANGPAFDDQDVDASRIFAIARRLGFRELATAQEVKSWSEQANDRWQATVADATQAQAA